MSRVKILPDDVKKICLALVQGYERRCKGVSTQLELRRVCAVEYAMQNVGQDLSEADREHLASAIIRNCIDGRNAPFEALGVDIMERTCFYDRRLRFLIDIAKYMELL